MTQKNTKPAAPAPAEEAPKTVLESVLHNNVFEIVDNTDAEADETPATGKVESEYELTNGLTQVNYV